MLADNLTVIDSLPVGLEFLETVNVTGAKLLSENQNGHVITWKLTNITTGSAVITVRIKVNDLGDLTNNLTVVGPRGSTQIVHETIHPVPIVDISVNITSDKDEYFVDDTDENGKSYDLTDDWIIPFMGNGTNITFTVYSQAVTPENNINNTVKVNCTEDEWNYTNNNATKLVSIVSLPYPVKTVNNSTPYYHDVIEYNLTVVNVGS